VDPFDIIAVDVSGELVFQSAWYEQRKKLREAVLVFFLDALGTAHRPTVGHLHQVSIE
jgi:hypothetical protein